MQENKPKYKEFYYCERCGKKFYNKFQDYILCYDCIKPVHEEIHGRLKTEILYQTKIDYDKFDPSKKIK